ncbi:MAG: hypothetical protein HY689_12575 [Chloroflexi bacterium]|nr:hypothetical protein [Chloroflexota bacterium]
MEHDEIAALEETLDALMGPQWARQRAAAKARLSDRLDRVMYLSWLREVVATWRLSYREESGTWTRRN